MTTKRAIKSVLHNFLGTYTSRYSEINGYWLFGFIICDLTEIQIDLINAIAHEVQGPSAYFCRLAVDKFSDQIRKAGLLESQVLEATLTLSKPVEQVVRPVNGRPSLGHDLRFSASAIMVDGKRYDQEMVVFVAPHDPKIESCSTRES